ncbi:MAG: nucleotidyltransferase domain-containing protein [Terriglobales bacterium]
MIPENQLNEFVSKMRSAAGDNLRSVILYGSAATGEFHADFSNVNLLCLFTKTSFAALSAIAPAVKWWTGKKHHPPLVMTVEELSHSADVFSIELLDMQQRHRVLFGDDPLAGLQIPMRFHREQLEYELREKTIFLRQQILRFSGHDRELWDLLLHSVSAFTTLFRHALVAMGVAPPVSKREAVQALSTRIQFDPSSFNQLLDIREKKAERKQFDAKDICGRYLTAIQQITNAVDTMLESPKSA